MEEKVKKVSVIGLGYIGLPTASLLATKGYEVVGVDISENVVSTINSGEIHIVEHGLDVLVRSAVNSGKLRASMEPVAADIYIIAVPTPFKNQNEPDLSYVQAAVEALAAHLQPGNIVILESTCPVGTTESVAGWIKALRPDIAATNIPLYIAYCPERVLPGRILIELVENDRIIGGMDAESTAIVAEFYRTFVSGALHLTDARTAEMTKLSENAFRDINIAFANELSSICDELGINVWELIRLANYHPRVNILQPGPGVGGHCIAVDPRFIVASAPEKSKLIQLARKVNDDRPMEVVRKILSERDKIPNAKIACLGLTFKADVDDVRESPAIKVIQGLLAAGVERLWIAAPFVKKIPEALIAYQDRLVFLSVEAAIQHADIVVSLVNHTCFYTVDRALLKDKAVIDTRGVWACAVS